MEFLEEEALPTWILRDKTPFGRINGANGCKRILFPEEVDKIRKSRCPDPRLPSVQFLLRRALELKKRLDVDPGLTQTALARELGISRVRVTQILNLLRLAPEIQQYILSLPPTTRQHGILTEVQLRNLIGKDWREQIEEFDRLLLASGFRYRTIY